MITLLKSIKYKLNGFTKVALNDSRNVLKRSQKYKWVKEFPLQDFGVKLPTPLEKDTMTILPNGTTILRATKPYEWGGIIRVKTIFPKNGTEFVATDYSSGARKIMKNGEYFSSSYPHGEV